MPAALAQQKLDLLRTLATTDRGRQVLPEQKPQILAQIAALEACNPTPCPTAAPSLLEGNWLTLFTTSADLLRLAKSFPLVTTAEIYQCIRTQTQRVVNVAEVQGRGWLEAWIPRGILAVSACFQPVSERRLQVIFESFLLGLQALMNYEIQTFLQLLEHDPDRIPALKLDLRWQKQRGWLDITYLDEDLRIGRGSEGSLFVLQKVGS